MAITVVPQEDWSRALPEVGKAIAQALIQKRQMEQQQWFQAIQLYSQTGSDMDERTFEQVFPYLKGRYAEYQNSISGVRRQLQRTESQALLTSVKETGTVPPKELATQLYNITPEQYDLALPQMMTAKEKYWAELNLTTEQTNWLKTQQTVATEQLKQFEQQFKRQATVDERNWYLGVHQARMAELALTLQQRGLDIQSMSAETQRQLALLQGRQIGFEMQRALATDSRQALALDLQARKEAREALDKRLSSFNDRLVAMQKIGEKIEDNPTLLAEEALVVNGLVEMAGGNPFLAGLKMKDVKRFYGPEAAEMMWKKHQEGVKRAQESGSLSQEDASRVLSGEVDESKWPGLLPILRDFALVGAPSTVFGVTETGARGVTDVLFGTGSARNVFGPNYVAGTGRRVGWLGFPVNQPPGATPAAPPGAWTSTHVPQAGEGYKPPAGAAPTETSPAGAMIGSTTGPATAGITGAGLPPGAGGYLTPQEIEKYEAMSKYIPTPQEIEAMLSRGGGRTSAQFTGPVPPTSGVIDYGQFLGNFMSPQDALNAERFKLNIQFPLKK